MSDIRDRISKLLNMTVKNGCTEDEQETALKLAAGLAARAGIELDALRLKGAPLRKVASKFKSDKLKPHQGLAAQAAAVLVGIRCELYNLGHQGLAFVGREELIEVAEDIMFWLFRQIEELYKQGLPPGMTKRDRSEFRKTFKAACAQRTLERAHEYMQRMKTNEATAKQATGQNALVVQGYFDTLKAEINEYYDDVYKKWQVNREAAQKRELRILEEMNDKEREAYLKLKAKVARAHAVRGGRSIPTGSGTDAGREAGDRVKLRKEID